ncbi:MAG TPA: NOP5/NOP56 family protein [Candidatus Acidoferrum sp.]|nr:NOP5/NOP56 family protein [Candidatus Acidoferrum sp.]
MPKRDFEELRERMLKSAKQGITDAYKSEEYALMQAVNAQIETSRSYNLAFERLSEWYGIYYPEVRIASPVTLAKLALVLNTSGIDKREIEEAVGDAEKAEEVYAKAQKTIGRPMEGDESKAVMGFSKMVIALSTSLEELDAYIKLAAKRILPNTTYLTDHMIAAELLSRAGSMERLATMPAGTVQLLGAEKALFKHIKFGSRPPKYGILFKLPEVTNGQREIRGRIARVYATKICIALKADYFSKNFIAEKLKKDLEESIRKIKEKPIVPKPEQPRQDFRRRDFNNRGRGFSGDRGKRRDFGKGRR